MPKKLFTVILLLQIVLIQYCFANKETSIEDSLLKNIAATNSPNIQAENYLALVKFYQKNDLDKAVNICNKAIEYCAENDNSEMLIEFMIEKAVCFVFTGKYNESSVLIFEIEQKLKDIQNDILWGKFYLLKNNAFITIGEFAKAMDNAINAHKYFQNANNNLGICKAYNNIGYLYDVTNNSQKALENYLLAREFAMKAENQELIANINNNIGVIYDELNNNTKALEYYFKALEYNDANGNLNYASTQLANIALVLADQKRFTESMAYFKKALKYSQLTKNIQSEALIYLNQGEVFIKLNKLDSTETYFRKSFKLYSKLNDNFSLAQVYNKLGELYILKNNKNQAIQSLTNAIVLAKKTGILDIQESSYKMLSKIYASQNNYKKAYEFQEKAFTINDSLRSELKLEELKHYDFQIEFRNQTGKFEQDLKRYDAQYKAEINKERKQKYLYALLLALIVIIAIILYRNFSRSSKINKKLVQKNREVEDQKELIEISNIELREQYSFTETLLNTIPNPVFYTDKGSHILGCNKAFEEISGMPIDDIIGLKTSQVNFDFDLLCESKKIQNFEKEQLIRNEGTLKFADNEIHDVICYRKGIIDANGKLIGILGIIIDVTDIREAEKQLKYSQSRLKEAINAKDKFFNIMAHDLKNPFNAILGLSSFIADDFDTHSEEDLREYIGLINQSSTKIYNLLENLLEWARAQSGSIEKNPSVFPINEIIQDCITLFNHSCDQKNIELKAIVDKEFEVKADKNMVMTVLRNLVSNAIKYTPRNGTISIETSSNNKNIYISVIDNGVGIQEQNIHKLFKIDHPLSTPGVENERGTGLGLIICNEFVKQNGGTINVSSTPNKGSNFTFSIPIE